MHACMHANVGGGGRGGVVAGMQVGVKGVWGGCMHMRLWGGVGAWEWGGVHACECTLYGGGGVGAWGGGTRACVCLCVHGGSIWVLHVRHWSEESK